MASIAPRAGQGRQLAVYESRFKAVTRRLGVALCGVLLAILPILLLLALISYQPADPSLNTRAGGPVQNWLGAPGAWGADLMLSLLGPLSGLLLPLPLLIGLRLMRGADAGHWGRSLRLTLAGIALVGTGASLVVGGAVNGLPAGWGGAIGLGSPA